MLYHCPIIGAVRRRVTSLYPHESIWTLPTKSLVAMARVTTSPSRLVKTINNYHNSPKHRAVNISSPPFNRYKYYLNTDSGIASVSETIRSNSTSGPGVFRRAYCRPTWLGCRQRSRARCHTQARTAAPSSGGIAGSPVSESVHRLVQN